MLKDSVTGSTNKSDMAVELKKSLRNLNGIATYLDTNSCSNEIECVLKESPLSSLSCCILSTQFTGPLRRIVVVVVADKTHGT